ncbi:MAG: thioredoxin family protein [Bacilli bacterium]|jgi:small redox-active disulfide protein 2|nr:thioredoxin family protein [Bacilli bacterium]
MKIQALGGCCKKSTANYEAIVQAVKELELKVEVEHVTDFDEIMNLGVMSTPGLAVDGKILSVGRALNVQQAKELISKVVKNESNCCCGDDCDCGDDCNCEDDCDCGEDSDCCCK